MNPDEIPALDSMVPPPMVTNFVMAPPPPLPASTMESMARFLLLLNEQFPLDRTPNFNKNHSVVFDTTGLSVGVPCLVVSIWIFKQLEWRCYPVGLTPEDLAKTPEGLIAEIVRVVSAETSKLILPSRGLPPQAV